MDSNAWLTATVWMALALAASIISIRVGISVALIEITVGVIAGNWIGLLVTAVIGSAVVPTLIAQRFFLPGSRSFETTEEDVEIFPEARPTT